MRRAHVALLVALAALAAPAASRAEVVEEIAAMVNDEIITRGDLQQAEQEMLAELYRAYSGKELDDRMRAAKAGLLAGLIDRKILVHRAGRLYDMDKMSESLLQSFKESQKIKSDEVAAKCIDHLKKNKLGRATFLPLNKMLDGRPRGKALLAEKEAAGFAIDLISFCR